jgi:membrane-associated phospholipid phosphatase
MKRWWIALGSAFAFITLAISVHQGLLDTLDSMIQQWARPDDVWGIAQLRADLIILPLRPEVLAGLLLALTPAYCVRHRSVRPATVVGGVGLATVALTLATKTAVSRADPHGSLANSHGGSFPSGHTTGVVVGVGLIVMMMMQPRTGRWVWLIPAFGGALMGASLLLQAAHWFTDIVGGGLLATGVLAAASGWTDWMHDRPENSHESAASQHRNGISFTASSERPTSIARLNNAVPDIGVTDCYDPGRGKFVLRSCGGL